MIRLPPAFQFSQSSLQDYVDCPARFELRYLREQPWPAPPAEPISEAEEADALGQRFHLLVERHYLGLPIQPDGLDPVTRRWWDAFTASERSGQIVTMSESHPEISATVLLDGQRITATFDLLTYTPDSGAMIYDWKTSARRPQRHTLERRLQTIIYPWLLVEVAPHLLGFALAPEQVNLTYWFANDPANPERFEYSTARYEQDRLYLSRTIERLLNTENVDGWALTPDVRLCRFCQYRSLHDRGDVAGSLDEQDDDAPQTLVNIEPDEGFVL
jgi:hypothetical protein